MNDKLRVMVTGASGNIGGKLVRYLLTADWCGSVIAVDKAPGLAFDGAPQGKLVCVQADLRDRADPLFSQLAGFDAIVHLAAQNPYPDASWDDSTASLDMALNLLDAARAARLPRVVFASSNHVMGGYKESGLDAGTLTPELPPRPGTRFREADGGYQDSTPYAVAKLMTERICLAQAIASNGAPSTVCVRIGWCRPGENRPEEISLDAIPGVAASSEPTAESLNDLRWARDMWLSNRDMLALFEAAVRADASAWPRPGIVVNGNSANAGMPWDRTAGARWLGFEAQDDLYAALDQRRGRPANPIDGFKVDRRAIRFVGHDLQRPECVLAEPDGTLWAADLRGGVMRIGTDGEQRLLLPAEVPEGSAPNGLAFDSDGAIRIANIGSGRLERLARDGAFSVLAERIDNRPIGKINFVLRDSKGRWWITVSTRRANWIDAIHPDVADGYIACLDDAHGWRIVADGFAFTNEARFDAAEEWLYVAETCGPRITRLRVMADGSLADRQTFGPERHDAFIDGISFDAHGNLWGTHIYRDRIFAIDPQGGYHVLLDDVGDAEAHDRMMAAFHDGQRLSGEMFDAAQGSLAPAFTSISFGGPDLRTVYIGSLSGTRIPSFRSPVAGLPLAHWPR